MINFSMKQLRYFEALARVGHFGRAAEECTVSQPALSMQIKELQELIGAPLLEKGARQVRLTALGEEFASRARDILRATEELQGLAQAARGPLSGQFRIGVIPTIAPYLLPQVITALTHQYDGLDLRPREAVTRKLIEGLNGGRLDAAIVALPISEPALHEEFLFEEEFVLVRPKADAEKPVPDASMLREMRLLLLEEGHCFRDQALSFCKAGAVPPRDLMEGSTLATLVQMVGARIGVTLIPEMSVAVETRSAEVSVVSLAVPRPTRSIGLVWRKSSPLADELPRVAALVRDIGLRNRSGAI